jgi:hypothetical protein
VKCGVALRRTAGNFICCAQRVDSRGGDNARAAGPDRASAAFVHQGRALSACILWIQFKKRTTAHGCRAKLKQQRSYFFFNILWSSSPPCVSDEAPLIGGDWFRESCARLSLCANLWPAESTQGGSLLLATGANARVRVRCTPWSSRIKNGDVLTVIFWLWSHTLSFLQCSECLVNILFTECMCIF